MKKMGGVGSIMSKLPNMPANLPGDVGDDMFKKIEAMIDSMTPLERKNQNLSSIVESSELLKDLELQFKILINYFSNTRK